MFYYMPQKTNNKKLMSFGILMGTTFTLFFGLFIPTLLGHSYSVVSWIIGTLFLIFSFISPNFLLPFYKGWMLFAEIASWVNSRIILGIIFFIGVTPMGFFIRILKYDAMKRKFEFNTESYRIFSTSKSKSSMEKPY